MLKLLTFISLLAICNSIALPTDDGEDLSFELNGVEHHETRKVEGRVVTLTDAMDGFIVILDFQRKILMVKNETSQMCFFSRLEEIHVWKNLKIPFMVETTTNGSADVDTDGQKTEVYIFAPAGEIPNSYMMLTNDVAVTKECSSCPSFWLEKKSVDKPTTRFWGLFAKIALKVLIIFRIEININ